MSKTQSLACPVFPTNPRGFQTETQHPTQSQPRIAAEPALATTQYPLPPAFWGHVLVLSLAASPRLFPKELYREDLLYTQVFVVIWLWVPELSQLNPAVNLVLLRSSELNSDIHLDFPL